MKEIIFFEGKTLLNQTLTMDLYHDILIIGTVILALVFLFFIMKVHKKIDDGINQIFYIALVCIGLIIIIFYLWDIYKIMYFTEAYMKDNHWEYYEFNH